MKKLFAVLAVSLFLGLIGCNAFDSPSNVVKKFHKYAAEGKVNDAYDLFSKDGKRLLDQWAGGASFLTKETDKIRNKGGIKTIEIIKEATTGDIATIEYQITFGNGTTEKHKENLIKEEGKWRIAVKK